MKQFDELENYIDDHLMMQLSKDLFTELPSSPSEKRRKPVRRTMAGEWLAAAACLLLVFAVWNFSSITAAAKGLAAFLFGGTVTEGETDGYYVLREAAAFGENGGYCLELAYRDGNDVYAVITKNNADGLGPVRLMVDGNVYEDLYGGNKGLTVAETAPGEEGGSTSIKGKSEIQCHFTGVEMKNHMTFQVEGQSVAVSLESPLRFALNQNMSMETAGIRWTVFPLAPDRSMVGVSMEEESVWGSGKYQYSLKLLNPVFIGADERKYEAESVGEDTQVWKISEKAEEPVIGFETRGVRYEIHDFDEGLLSYTFQVPERGSSTEVDDVLVLDGLELRVKRVTRSEEDHIKLSFEPETELGTLMGGSMRAEKQTSHGCGAGGDEFSLSVGYTYYVMADDQKTVKETVHQFPYQTGDQMTVTIEELRIEKEVEGEVRF
ncbi:hypothetical protein GPL15_15130 [Clostridium sp. MCC353]|uniref:hypothetical protein n=1 Tax=Clostridium sp. MCC353 TaxID=2592646 RepID=UPI001C01EF21|nr:hypothetical protein [Clostridium sp. MCC353]MBT9777835.1 hypothetical protein [Clostridium sp. MCC353]